MGRLAEIRITTILAPNPGPFTLDGTRSYVLNGEVAIDPGPLIESHVRAILEAAPNLSDIFITHRHEDHIPAAARLKQDRSATISAPAGVLNGISDRVLRDGAISQSGSVRLEELATPGHTAEHFCFLTPGGDLFSGDTILGEGTTIVEGHMRDYLASLKRLRQRNPRRIYPGHGPVREDAVAWIDYYIEHREQRERQILDAIRRGAQKPQKIRRLVYPDLDPRLHRAAERQIAAHLEYLQERGLI